MKTNIFHHTRKQSNGTKSVKRGKHFSGTSNAKSDTKKSNNPSNKSSWYPGGVNVISDGIKGHYITREIEINQGHSNTRKYGNQNGSNALDKSNIGRTPAPHGKSVVESSGTMSMNQSNTQSLDHKFHSKVFGTFMNNNSRSTNKTYNSLSVGTNNYFMPIARNNSKEKTTPVSDSKNKLGETPLEPCLPVDYELINCLHKNDLTENGKDYHTTDKNTPYIQTAFENDENQWKKLNETNVESTTLKSATPAREDATPKDIQHDKSYKKPKLIFENKTKEASKSSVVMKIPRGNINLDLFAVDSGFEKGRWKLFRRYETVYALVRRAFQKISIKKIGKLSFAFHCYLWNVITLAEIALKKYLIYSNNFEQL